MSEPADSPAPRPENAETTPAGTPSEPPQEAAPAAPHGPETPMGDSRPDHPAEPEPVPAQATPPRPEAHAVAAPAPAPTPPAPHPLPAGAVTAAEYQRQAAYYAQLQRQPRFTPPPNPRWHRPGETPKPAIIVLVIAVALFGAWAAFHPSGVGVGLSLTGIAMLAVPLAAGHRSDLVPRVPGAVLVAALWSVAAFRDAGWVVLLCTVTAFLLTPVALAPQRRFSGAAVTVFMGWLEGLAESFRWAKRGRRAKTGGGSSMRNLWVVLVTAALLLVFGGLFAAADSTFADLIVRLMPEIDAAEVFLRLVLAAVLFPLVLVWTYTAVVKPRFDSERPEGEHRTVSRFELSVPLGALNLLFMAFIAVQLRVFLGGEAYVMETAGLTFAEYARKGFWQLSFVAALALAVIAVAAWLAPKRTKQDRWAARILLGTLCALSMVVIASALYRMYTYAETYGLTRMRVWIFTVEIWLAVLFALVIVCCWKLRAGWLPRAVLGSGALALLGLAAANPDALIARYNLDHEHAVDLVYLSGLSDDAAPAFADADLSRADRDCVLSRGTEDEERALLAWNLGYQRALDLREAAAESTTSCEWMGTYQSYGDFSNQVSGNAFFTDDRCYEFDTTEAAAMFRQLGHDAAVLDSDDALREASTDFEYYSGATGTLYCGYSSETTEGYLRLEVKRFADAAGASDAIELDLLDAAGMGYEATELADGSFTGIGTYNDDYRYAVVDEELYVSVFVVHPPDDAAADEVAREFAGQVRSRYREFA
jgi:hypothetical protein